VYFLNIAGILHFNQKNKIGGKKPIIGFFGGN
jgi:hypothetical protein